MEKDKMIDVYRNQIVTYANCISTSLNDKENIDTINEIEIILKKMKKKLNCFE